MQTPVQRSESIRMWNGILKLDWVNIWAIKSAWLEVSFLLAQLKFANTKLPPRKKLDEVKFNAEIVELHLDNLAKIDGIWDLLNTAGTPVIITDESYGDVWIAYTPIKLKSQNGDDSLIAITNVKAWGSTVTTTSYSTYVWDGENGEKGATYLVFKSVQAGEITVTYDFTPNTTKTLTYKDLLKALTLYELIFENTDENGKKFGIKIYKGYATSNLAFDFPEDDDLESVSSIPVEFIGYPDQNNNVFEIFDEQSV